MSFWTVAQCETQREHVAAQFLAQSGFETYLPKILSKHGARERAVPLFPSYLFVEITQHWWSVRWTIGVSKLLMMADDQPAVVQVAVIRAIRQREGDDGLVKLPKPRGLTRGDRVRILRGGFEGRLGIYQSHSGAERSRILLDLLGRKVPTVLKTSDMAMV
jgi:transcription elongation factor/antiterminator RfaH